ncbi:hypothetical protein LCGC14_0334800 [marine sediment metagenome]|uniref:Uncharacterized protein n=1 Tax=marine sediment metagenome TaxID=412755 RepID=A0A0F9TYD1_9ZZZZ
MTIALTILSIVLLTTLYRASEKIVRLRAERREWWKSVAKEAADKMVEENGGTVKVTIGNEQYVAGTDDTEGPEQ